MTRTEVIDNAIKETLKVHPDYLDIYASTITSTIQAYVNPKNFTSTNGARASISNLDSIDFLKYALDELNIIYGALTVLYPKVTNGGSMSYNEWNSLCKSFPEVNSVLDLIYEIKRVKGNIFSYFKANQSTLFHLLDTVFKVRFNSRFFDKLQGYQYSLNLGEEFRNKIDKIASRGPEFKSIQDKIEEGYMPYTKIDNIKYNPAAINRCIREIISGAQVKHHHNEYAIDGELFASQDVGKMRTHQEDSTLIMTHPQNRDFKILAVADGMGGASAGEEVSNYIVSELSKWFSELKPDYYENPQATYQVLTQKVLEINNRVCQKYNNTRSVNAGSTLVCAIVTKNTTLILNVGDSRAYVVKGGRLNIVTEDESLVWMQMKQQALQENRGITLDDISNLRFAPGNNQITRAIGFPELPKPQVISVNNNLYDQLLLFSDGVHDVLSSKDIQIIANNTSPELITKVIVETAISKNAQKRNRRGDIEEIVPAGKDNTTAAAYIRR